MNPIQAIRALFATIDRIATRLDRMDDMKRYHVLHTYADDAPSVSEFLRHNLKPDSDMSSLMSQYQVLATLHARQDERRKLMEAIVRMASMPDGAEAAQLDKGAVVTIKGVRHRVILVQASGGKMVISAEPVKEVE